MHRAFWFELATLPMGDYPYAPADSNRRSVRVGGHPPPPHKRRLATTGTSGGDEHAGARGSRPRPTCTRGGPSSRAAARRAALDAHAAGIGQTRPIDPRDARHRQPIHHRHHRRRQSPARRGGRSSFVVVAALAAAGVASTRPRTGATRGVSAVAAGVV